MIWNFEISLRLLYDCWARTTCSSLRLYLSVYFPCCSYIIVLNAVVYILGLNDCFCISQAALTQLIQYYHRFQKVLSQAPFRSLQIRNELINIHHVMVEVKKHKPTFWRDNCVNTVTCRPWEEAKPPMTGSWILVSVLEVKGVISGWEQTMPWLVSSWLFMRSWLRSRTHPSSDSGVEDFVPFLGGSGWVCDILTPTFCGLWFVRQSLDTPTYRIEDWKMCFVAWGEWLRCETKHRHSHLINLELNLVLRVKG